MAVAVAEGDDGTEHIVQPAGREEDVDEARTRDLRSPVVRWWIGVERGHDLDRDVTRGTTRGLGDLECDVRRPIPVLGLLRRVERHTVGWLGHTDRGQRAAKMSSELVTHRRCFGAYRPSLARHGSIR